MNPRIRFACLPTPVQQLPRLSAELGGLNIWIKRDDQTGLALGGNKARKLEFILGEAKAVGARTLVTVGAVQSNHCRQVAALACKFGLGCILVLSGTQPELASGNLLLDELFGAELVFTSRPERENVLKKTFEQAWSDGRRPYLIPLGGSTGLGALGFEAAFHEMIEQEAHPDWVVVASSSGGTQAGLVLGAHRAKWHGKVLGISIDESEDQLQRLVAEIANQAGDLIRETHRFKPADILVNAEYLGAGYGIMDAPEVEAIQMFARTEGLLLDPVYTGRAAAGLIDLTRKKVFKPGEVILFWHTGGTPAVFADHYSAKLAG